VEEKRPQRCHWWNLITVEPVMFLYMMAFMLTSVVEQAFFVHKACRANLNFSDTICSNLADIQYKEYNKEVQVRVYTTTVSKQEILLCKVLFLCIHYTK
jgi:PCFT/HCP family folate transporter-like MFS transporter 1/3